MKLAEILVLVTGGTFDKEYDMLEGKLYFNSTHLPEMFDRGRCTLPLVVRTTMMVDSLDMTAEDRALIAHNCQRCTQRRILITHGTDTMVETAQVLAQDPDIQDKTIVITGAMIPYHFGSSSDGFFNLGAALAFVQTLPAGVYVCMNGRYYDWNKVRKNRQTGYFEAI